jgi:hypothetical protein
MVNPARSTVSYPKSPVPYRLTNVDFLTLYLIEKTGSVMSPPKWTHWQMKANLGSPHLRRSPPLCVKTVCRISDSRGNRPDHIALTVDCMTVGRSDVLRS